MVSLPLSFEPYCSYYTLRFKLHLRPKSQSASPSARRVDEALPPLPPNKTVVQLFSDYMTYLLECAKQYISDSHGQIVWTSLQNNIIFVLTHPNGWGGPQQAQMRQAAIRAGLVPNTDDGRSRINFVTEGEASLHFCLSNGLALASTVCVQLERGNTLWLTVILS
jgi:hypothetical protein